VPFRWLSLWPRGGVSDHRHLREPAPCLTKKTWTNRVRSGGRSHRKKRMWHEMIGDVSGSELFPDPSLGGAPQVEGPTTRLLGPPWPAVCAMHPLYRPAGQPGTDVETGMTQRRSRGCGDFPPGL
jgi:hypothetical protein